jgi:cephalosporin hydroxylase
MTGPEAVATDGFHRAYYDAWENGTHHGRHTMDLAWFGYRTLKCPFDLWTFQEILVETRPHIVVECGTRFGGSALFMASIFDLQGRGQVLTIDTDPKPPLPRPRHPRITYLLGSSTDPDVIRDVRERCRGKRVMVVLDSDHSATHVRAELDAYADLVSKGCYLVVEDTNVNGHPVAPEFGPGPGEALQEWLAGRDDFVADAKRERFMLTLNPGGYLRRVRPAG